MDDLIPPKATGEIALPPDMLHKTLSSDLSDGVAELHVLRDVIENSYAAMSLYFDRYTDVEPESENFIIRMSLFRDAIVQFASCFSRSEKEKIKPTPEAVYEHAKNWEQPYKIMHDLRDAYAAHNFGRQWQHDVFAVLEWNDARNRVRLNSLGDAKGNFGGFAKKEEAKILKLIEMAREHINELLAKAREKLWLELVATSADEMYAYPDYTPDTNLGFDATRDSRRKFRATQRLDRGPRAKD